MKSARELSLASLDAVKSRQRELWLSLFADDAIVEDPVGQSPFDPAGKGHRGHEAIGRFYDMVVAQNTTFEYRIREWYACGNEVASAATFVISNAHATNQQVDLIIIHKANDEGKLTSLRAFWTFPSAD
ncbi:nuclear transport factor 2 family protein [Sphingomonas sp. KC8]|uniref:nuclear transport factor 2 family protein n=1 Tax=Sphingomonas sp. KC8 TaxID=1030157 RepID=UPI000248A06A|nr:nuclear transport factor 2 family protein [Sphingomonas sp. KC8]ARS27666.1 ketosteroid isomerase [Sphingomonas sp. KC8]